MLKKITTIITANQKAFGRKVVIMGGVVLGIGIGLLLNKDDDLDMVIVEEVGDEDEITTGFINDDGEQNDGSTDE